MIYLLTYLLTFMTHKILKSTERGQITLPKEWRDSFGTNNYVVSIHKKTLVIAPLHVDLDENEEVIFDADRDNGGKGVSVDSMINMLEKILHE